MCILGLLSNCRNGLFYDVLKENGNSSPRVWERISLLLPPSEGGMYHTQLKKKSFSVSPNLYFFLMVSMVSLTLAAFMITMIMHFTRTMHTCSIRRVHTICVETQSRSVFKTSFQATLLVFYILYYCNFQISYYYLVALYCSL